MVAASKSRSARDVLGAGALVGATLALFYGTWQFVYWFVAVFSGPASVAAWSVTAALVLFSVYMGASAGASVTLRILAFQFAIVLLFVVFVVVAFLCLSVLVLLLLENPVWAILVSLLATGALVVGACALLVLGLWGADTGRDWALFVRMVAASLLLGIVMIGLLAVIWVLSFFVSGVVLALAGLELSFQSTWIAATAVTATVTLGLVRQELRVVGSIERQEDASVVSPAEGPHLHAVVNRVAAQMDVPAPTIAVSDTRAPEAMVVGYHPANMHLVLSQGTIDALDDPELIAVIAHELGHVANRDAIVMTALSVPVLLADWLRPNVDTSNTALALAAGVIWLAFLLPWTVSELTVSMLSRERETAADDIAVETLGTPATLAAALQSLEGAARDAPEADLRNAEGVSQLSIVPLEERGDGPLDRLLSSHPSTERRIERLREASRTD